MTELPNRPTYVRDLQSILITRPSTEGNTLHYFDYVSEHEVLAGRKTRTALQQTGYEAVWSFKNCNPLIARAMAFKVANALRDIKDPKGFTFVCIPSHEDGLYHRRCDWFSALVCRLTGMRDGTPSLHVADAVSARLSGDERKTPTYTTSCRELFEGREAVVFDDVITSGRTAEGFSDYLGSMGCQVKRSVFIARALP